jgi:hypothetical protein
MEKNSHSKYCNRRTNERDPKGNEVHNTGNVLLLILTGTGAVNNE